MSGREAILREAEAAEILRRLKPSLRPTQDELRRAAAAFREIKAVIDATLSSELKGIEYVVELEGSVAKGTAISGDLDLDVFILIGRKDLNNRWLETHVVGPLVRRFTCLAGYRVSLRYASHPYIHLITPSGIEADIVPAYRAPSPAAIVTPVDRTPFHTRYIKEHLAEPLKDEVRLLKKFFKSIGVYGAEIRNEGFSGYLCELLILKYGSFLNLLKNIVRWREPQVIAVDEGALVEASELRKVFRNAPLIVLDPVDPRRNAAASVSRRSFALAMVASYEFLLNPDEKFFNPVHTYEDLNRLETVLNSTGRAALIIFWRMKRSTPPDIMWGEVKSAGRSLANVLRSRSYTVTDVRFWAHEDLGILAAYIEIFKTFGDYVLRRGPPRAGPEMLRFMHKHLGDVPVRAWIDHEGTPYAVTKVSKSFVDIVFEYVNTHKLKHAEAVVVCERLRNAASFLKEKIAHNSPGILTDFLYWLTEAVLKTPPWLARGVSSSGSM